MPATVKPGWALGRPPVVGALPTYYFDHGGAQLWWVIPTPTDYEMVQDGEIPWPFVEDCANVADVARLGFHDLEDLPLSE